MDTPLFGEERPIDKFIQFALVGTTALFILLTFIFSIVNGVQDNPINIIYGVALLFVGVLVFILWRWYRVGDLDPKFKYLIGLSVLTVILFCIVGNIYFWKKSLDVYEECPGQFYDATVGDSYQYPSRCYNSCPQGFCLDAWATPPGFCYNCTNFVPKPLSQK